MESLLIEKNTRSYPSRKLFRKKKDGSSNIHMEEESVKGNMRNGVNRLHIGLETEEAVSPPLGIDDALPLTEFMDGERDSCGEENASIAPCKDTLPSILSREECVVSTALNHPVLDVLKDSILPPPEVNQIGSHTNIQNTYSLVICTPHQQSPIIDKVILIDDAVDIAEPPAVHSSPLPPVLFGDIEPLTGLTYIQIIMIAISVRDHRSAYLTRCYKNITKQFS